MECESTILRTATLAFVHSTAEYCAPVWCRSAHNRLMDKPINDTLRKVTACLRSIPADNLFVLAGIQPTELRRQKTILSLARCAQEPKLLHHERPVSPSFGHLRQFKSRHIFMSAALELLSNLAQSGTSLAQWGITNGTWGGKKTLSNSIYSLQMPVQHHRERSFPDLHGSDLIVFELALGYPAQQCANVVWLPLWLVSVVQRSNR